MPGLSSLQQGFGMLNVDAAWDYIKTHKDDPYEDVSANRSFSLGNFKFLSSLSHI